MRERRNEGLIRATVRRRACSDLTAAKRRQVVELARAMAAAREQYLRDYWGSENVGQVLGPYRRLVEARRKAGWASPVLSPHQNKVSLETALGIIRASWRSAIGRAQKRIICDDRLGAAERIYVVRLLRDPARIQACLDGAEEREAALPRQVVNRLRRRIRRLLSSCRGRLPDRPRQLWFDIDTNLYRAFVRSEDRHFKGAWLALTSQTKGRRIAIPLRGNGVLEFASRTGHDESRPSVRVYVGSVIEFETARRIEPGKPETPGTAGVDFGYRALLTLSTGDPETADTYGDDEAQRSAIADRAAERQRNRQRLRALARSLRDVSPKKAARIQRRNLAGHRAARLSRREKRGLRQSVNRALNQMFAEHRPAQIVHEHLAFSAFRLRRVANRRLARWLWGFMRTRLRYKAELNGVELCAVNAAYTSQTCPRCWFTSAGNRRKERFLCIDCGYTGSADAVAATNVLTRGSDPAITRWMPRRDIQQILEARWRSARNGRAWGSNVEVPGPDVPRDSSLGTSRELPSDTTVVAVFEGPYGVALSRAHSHDSGPWDT